MIPLQRINIQMYFVVLYLHHLQNVGGGVFWRLIVLLLNKFPKVLVGQKTCLTANNYFVAHYLVVFVDYLVLITGTQLKK